MKLGTIIRISALFAAGTAFAGACSSKTVSGTDSSTHWLDDCKTNADCGGLSCKCGVCTKLCTDSADCRGLAADADCTRATWCDGSESVCVKHEDGGTPSEGGPCPEGIAGGGACDGHVAQCWTACVQGYREQFVCSAFTWTAGHGLFPCDDAGAPQRDAGMTPGAGGASTGGSAGSSGGVGAGGRIGNGAGGAAGSGPGGSDAGSVSTACRHSEDCALVPTVCCPICRPAMLSERIAIAAASVSTYMESKCATTSACPPCVPSDGTIESLCSAGECTAIDTKPYAACKTATDCKIVPKDCCPCGTLPTSAWAAVSDPAAFTRTCVVDCVACPGGALHATEDFTQCNSDGYCELISGG